MLIHVVSDVHGNVEDLSRAADGADRLLVLGDLLDYVDYHDPSAGILGAVFGPERVSVFTDLRSRGDFPALHAYNLHLWSSVADPIAVMDELVEQRYRDVLEAIPSDTLMVLGNVDVAAAWAAVAPPNLQALDGETRVIAGLRFGFVGGGSGRPRAPMRIGGAPWLPFIRSAEVYEQQVQALGQVDVLCSHIPPQLALMRYDTIPARLEMFGPGLLEAIDEHQPRFTLSGHVHQPISQRVRRGRTECVNVGYFRRSGQPFRLAL
jgi:Icc-related predicted phosphoesterase